MYAVHSSFDAIIAYHHSCIVSYIRYGLMFWGNFSAIEKDMYGELCFESCRPIFINNGLFVLSITVLFMSVLCLQSKPEMRSLLTFIV